MLLLDNNISPRLAHSVQIHFPGTKHVVDFRLETADDLAVWDFAKTNSYHILTKDFDFVHLIAYKGFPPKVVWLTCGNVTTRFIEALLIKEKSLILQFISDSGKGLLQLQ